MRQGAAAPPGEGAGEAIRFEGVSVWRTSGGVRATLLEGVDWRVERGERWGILGPNGSGKTTLLRVASAQARPSAGSAEVLGARLGRVALQSLRPRIGLVEPALGRRFYPVQRAIDVVAGGSRGTILLPEEPSAPELERALAALAAIGVGELATRPFERCSEGERARILLARALVAERELLALDEPAAGLDLPGRELLLQAFSRAVAERPGLTTLTVTHHVEELPPATSHLLLLRAGRVVAAGPLDAVLTDALLSECFGLPLGVERRNGRISVRLLGG
jgi:iron complex transport system ATP-binding protein